MSLIDDALKKTQSALTRREKPAVKPTSSILQSQIELPHPAFDPQIQKTLGDHKTPVFSWKEIAETMAEFFGSRTFLLLTATIVLLAFTALLYKNSTRIIEALHTPNRTSHPAAAAQVTIAPISTIRLDGTLATGREHAALINDNLYYTGQTINGYYIQSILYNKIILLDPETKKTYTLTPVLHP